ncbi:hypothetical protein CLPUN_26970 [Clostridium puniceum]|uniref:DUF5673 domain-containing protein n=1 Tax=Clostridium puniceum TaxID=29367 RepID=A0A1S8TGE3_9CLOT|nr:DUF5673 domain-containing protein [Clostridium puniceum]OOM76465.1 hypothetical protein CLPUN_26970 [Clostridium puniceum]
MSVSSIVAFIFILIVDIVLIKIDRKNKLIIAGTNKYKVIMPVVVIGFVIYTAISKNFKVEDMAILIGILPLAFVGNKCGITERGILTNSYVLTWNKIETYSLEEQRNKYVLSYKTNVGVRRLLFNEKDKDEVKKYLLGIRELKYARK